MRYSPPLPITVHGRGARTGEAQLALWGEDAVTDGLDTGCEPPFSPAKSSCQRLLPASKNGEAPIHRGREASCEGRVDRALLQVIGHVRGPRSPHASRPFLCLAGAAVTAALSLDDALRHGNRKGRRSTPPSGRGKSTLVAAGHLQIASFREEQPLAEQVGVGGSSSWSRC